MIHFSCYIYMTLGVCDKFFMLHIYDIVRLLYIFHVTYMLHCAFMIHFSCYIYVTLCVYDTFFMLHVKLAIYDTFFMLHIYDIGRL